MNIDIINPHVMKILISARDKDSISSISSRIGLSYGWTHKWVKKLVSEGIFKEKWRGLELQKNNTTYKSILEFIKNNFNNAQFYYSVLNLFGIDYCLTKTDAVYFWTEGRYNIARYRDYYPVFVKINKKDYNLFLNYCKKLGLNINKKKGIFYSPKIIDIKNKNIKCSEKEELRVETLKDTIRFMKDNIYNFQPALEMIQEKYGKKLNINYSEANFYGKSSKQGK
ncbi:MAG: hypothetical protein ACOCUU_02975 [Nanoarchaeota archaeon]